MKHLHNHKTLDRKKGSRTALLKTLATQLLVYEKITTTEAKAKTLKPLVEKIITRGKTDTLANRRQLLKVLTTKKSVKKVFEVLGPKYLTRKGGYCRIIKLGKRQGDASSQALIELV